MLLHMVVPRVSRIAEGHEIGLALQHQTDCEEDERRGRDAEARKPATPPMIPVDAGHVLGVNAQAALERSGCRHHLLDALGDRLRLPAGLVSLLAGRLETLVQRLALRPQGGDALGQYPGRLRRPVLLPGQLCRLVERAASIPHGLRQRRRLAGERRGRPALRPGRFAEFVDPGRHSAHRLKDLPDSDVTRTGLRRGRCWRRSRGAGSRPSLRSFRPAHQQVAPREIVLPGLRTAAPILRRHGRLPTDTDCS